MKDFFYKVIVQRGQDKVDSSNFENYEEAFRFVQKNMNKHNTVEWKESKNSFGEMVFICDDRKWDTLNNWEVHPTWICQNPEEYMHITLTKCCKFNKKYN